MTRYVGRLSLGWDAGSAVKDLRQIREIVEEKTGYYCAEYT